MRAKTPSILILTMAVTLFGVVVFVVLTVVLLPVDAPALPLHPSKLWNPLPSLELCDS